MTTKFGLLLWLHKTMMLRNLIGTAVVAIIPLLCFGGLMKIRSENMPDIYEEPFDYQPLSLINTTWDRHMTFDWEVFYSPNNDVVEELMKEVNITMNLKGMRRFPDSRELRNYLIKNEKRRPLAAVAFHDIYPGDLSLPKDLRFDIIFPAELRYLNEFNESSNPDQYHWQTDNLFPLVPITGPRNYKYSTGGGPPGYYTEKFVALQSAISMAFIKASTAEPPKLPTISLQRFPYPPATIESTHVNFRIVLPMMTAFAFIGICSQTVQNIAFEKEKQLKEIMKIMGLPNWMHWMAWFIRQMMFLIVLMAVESIFLKFLGNPSIGWIPLFNHSDPSAVWVFLLCYSLALTTFCFMISVMFSKASTATLAFAIPSILIILCLPALPYESLGFEAKMAMCLLHYTSLFIGFRLILGLEYQAIGLRWNNFFSPVSIDDDFSVGHATMMLLVSTVLYLLITLYIEQVFPGEYGIPEKWHFPITKPFSLLLRKFKKQEFKQTPIEGIVFEDYPTDKKAGIQINSLRKVFRKKKVAVDSLTLNIFEDEITILLGDNGAGKTTTMSMLIGMFPPTSGTALVNGYDIRTDISGVQKSIGICPQHNILFDDLTVKEHIIFFGKLKGLSDEEVEKEVNKYIEMLNLTSKEKVLSKGLSGGMKRKLCIALALCGGSKVVFCDEPTSGMDPASRRDLWDLVQSEKSGRTIVFSTHFMDEADVLGDRIAIMSQGQLKCYGTSFFLKKAFGAGYELILEKGPYCNVGGVTSLIANYVPDIEIASNIGSELSYKLDGSYSRTFERMLGDLENRMGSLDVKGYGVTLTTLEEVFIKVTSKNETDNLDNLTDLFEYEYLTGLSLIWSQLRAMFLKNILYIWKNIFVLLVQILTPIIFIGTAILISQVKEETDLSPLTIDLKSYKNNPVILLSDQVKDDSSLTKRFLDNYKSLLEDSSSQKDSLQKIDSIRDYILGLNISELVDFNYRCLAGVTVDNENITAWFNNQPYHTVPLTINLVFNALLRGSCTNCSIQVTNFPLPFTMETRMLLLLMQSNVGFQLWQNFGLALCIVPSFYVIFYIRERATSFKLLQFISGTSVWIYWISALIMDYLTFVITIILSLLVLSAFKVDGWSSVTELTMIFILILLYIWSILPMVYLFSMKFNVSSKGFTNFFYMGFLLFILSFYCLAFFLNIPGVQQSLAMKLFSLIVLLVPQCALLNGLNGLQQSHALFKKCQKICDATPGCETIEDACEHFEGCCNFNYFGLENPGIGRNMIVLFLTGFVAWIFLLLKELKAIRKMNDKLSPTQIPDRDLSSMDNDVVAEIRRIENMKPQEIMEHNLIIRNMSKVFNKFLAVNQLSLGVEAGECFGLLGVNGAGKTTSFKMLTGDEKISSGDAWVKGISIKSDLRGVYNHIGYCPQFDALLEEFTGRETLRILCLIRGVPSKEIAALSRNFSVSLNFVDHLDKRTQDQSGGNKRKLSTALALIGRPSVVYLDEPTTGMDPGAKRHLWKVISAYRDLGETIILTSHSMEECEALCTRLAIMVAGEFKCLGSRQHLKNKFSMGYLLTIQLNRDADTQANLNNEMNRVKNFITGTIRGATVQEEYQGRLVFIIPLGNKKLSALFGEMEVAKLVLEIESYSLNQTSLEQIFLSFTLHE